MPSAALLLLLWLPLASPSQPVSKLTLKNGTVYVLRGLPQYTEGRVVFTTVDGKVLSIDEREVASAGQVTPTPRPPTTYNPQDSRALGAIARQQRDRRGKSAEVAPRPTPRATRTPKPTRTPRARRSPSPDRGAGRASPG